jgi:hypothetical protein
MEIKVIQNNLHSTIKNFLKTNFKDNYIYYNNPKSIKIQIPNPIAEEVVNFLQSQNINFQLTTPPYIIYKLLFVRNMTQIIIKK